MAAPQTPTVAPRALDARAVRAITRRLARAEAPWLHREVARRMAERLPVIRKQPSAVIEWSAWLGGSDEALQAAYPEAQRVIVESDAALLARMSSQAQRPWWSPRRWLHAVPPVLAPEALPPAAGELLWSNMMLHAVCDPPALMAQWQQALAVEGFLMFSTLGPGTLPELRALYEQAGWGLPMAELVDMHDLGDMLLRAGFADPVMDQETITLTFASPASALAELRTLGGNAAPGRFAGLRTPRWRRRLEQALQGQADPHGRIALRFEVVYGHAFRPAPQARVQPRTEVSLEAMREMVRSGRPTRGGEPGRVR
ncbi:MAG: biotin synthase [Pseudomonadota bacterium]